MIINNIIQPSSRACPVIIPCMVRVSRGPEKIGVGGALGARTPTANQRNDRGSIKNTGNRRSRDWCDRSRCEKVTGAAVETLETLMECALPALSAKMREPPLGVRVKVAVTGAWPIIFLSSGCIYRLDNSVLFNELDSVVIWRNFCLGRLYTKNSVAFCQISSKLESKTTNSLEAVSPNKRGETGPLLRATGAKRIATQEFHGCNPHFW